MAFELLLEKDKSLKNDCAISYTIHTVYRLNLGVI